MKNVNLRAFLGFLWTLLILVPAVFVPVWTFRYWQGWACLAAFFIPAAIISVSVARSDPALLERRLKAGAKAEKETGQKVVQSITGPVFLADFVFPAFDHRFGWSQVPAWACAGGEVMMVAGFVIVFRVLRENSFASGVIEVAEDQRVIATGPYAIVRHPMYTGALIMLFGIPPALGSWWGMLINLPMTAGLVWRLLDEERFLGRNLRGYTEYVKTVRYRLVPRVW